MRELIIVGAGGFGREAYYLAKVIGKWKIKGFIDDNLNALDNINIGSRVLGSITDWIPSDNEVYAMGVSNPKIKEAIVMQLLEKGAKFVSLIHPRAIIYESAEIGQGCIIGGMSNIGDAAKIGDFVNVAGSIVGQDSIVGDFSTTTAFVNLAGARIGKRVFIGSHSVVLGKSVGDDAYICAGSIVLSNIKPGIKVMGYPAKKLDI